MGEVIPFNGKVEKRYMIFGEIGPLRNDPPKPLPRPAGSLPYFTDYELCLRVASRWAAVVAKTHKIKIGSLIRIKEYVIINGEVRSSDWVAHLMVR